MNAKTQTPPPAGPAGKPDVMDLPEPQVTGLSNLDNGTAIITLRSGMVINLSDEGLSAVRRTGSPERPLFTTVGALLFNGHQLVNAEEWWTNHARLLTVRMQQTGVEEFRITRRPDTGRYAYEVTPVVCAVSRALDEYRSLAVKAYGPNPTEYQRGVLIGIDCASVVTESGSCTLKYGWHVLATEPPPDSPRVVVATDGEGQWMAVWDDGRWVDAHTEEEFDSVILAWHEQLELPSLS